MTALVSLYKHAALSMQHYLVEALQVPSCLWIFWLYLYYSYPQPRTHFKLLLVCYIYDLYTIPLASAPYCDIWKKKRSCHQPFRDVCALHKLFEYCKS
jgi:hypothetical protein